MVQETEAAVCKLLGEWETWPHVKPLIDVFREHSGSHSLAFGRRSRLDGSFTTIYGGVIDEKSGGKNYVMALADEGFKGVRLDLLDLTWARLLGRLDRSNLLSRELIDEDKMAIVARIIDRCLDVEIIKGQYYLGLDNPLYSNSIKFHLRQSLYSTWALGVLRDIASKIGQG